MALYYRTQGFIFKKEDRSESDREFSIFTEDFGRVQVFGKAIRKIASKLRGGIEIFSLSEIEFIQGKNKKTLTDAAFLETFGYIAESPCKFVLAYKMGALVDAFVREQEQDIAIYGILKDTFLRLNDPELQPSQSSLLYCCFFWNFVSLLGYAPELSMCAACNQKLNPRSLYFSNREGGVICNMCEATRKEAAGIMPDTVKVLRLMLNKNWDTVKKLKIDNAIKNALKEVSENYMTYLINSHAAQPT